MATDSTPPATEPAVPRHAPLLVDAREACRLLSLGRRSVWLLTNSGELPVVRVGRAVRYSVEGLRQWIEQRQEGGTRDE